MNAMQRQRRLGGGQSSRGSSPIENGHRSSQPLGGQLCPGDSACLASSSSSSSSRGGSGGGGSHGLICGCIRKTSPLRRALNKLRFRTSRAAAKGSQRGALGAYLAALVFVMWCGMQTSALLRGGGDGAGGSAVAGGEPAAAAAGEQARPQRELATSGVGVDTPPVPGYGEHDVGPRLAYGIMVYQRVGYSPQMTLDQWARMFDALYDQENT